MPVNTPCTLLPKREAAKLIGRSVGYLQKYRDNGSLLEGVHYFKASPTSAILYNAELLHDWEMHRSDPDAHLAAIEQFLAKLPSNQKKRRSA